MEDEVGYIFAYLHNSMQDMSGFDSLLAPALYQINSLLYRLLRFCLLYTSVNQSVITAGGIHGTIKEITDDYIVLEIASNVKIKIDKNSVDHNSN